MPVVSRVCVLFLLLFAGVVSDCPTWFTNTTGQCECGEEMPGKLICHEDEERVDVRVGTCVTFEYSTGSVLAGACPYGYSSNMTNRVYSSLPSDPNQLNETTCGPYNREGLLCGQCIKGFGPAVYSYDLRCANCTGISTGYAISLYLLLVFLPITIVFFLVVIFPFNITSGPLLGYVMFCQAWTFAVKFNLFLSTSVLSHLPSPLQTLLYASVVVADVWNLHFFRFVFPSFCLSDEMSGIHVHMLSFLTAVYPVLLMATVYIVLKLYTRDCRVIKIFWKPFGICFAKFKSNWNASDSVIHTLATFIMLSSYSVIYDTYAIFVACHVYNVNSTLPKHVLYFDPSVVMYSLEHILYLTVGVVLCFLLAVCPALLLCLYPTRLYERLSQCCGTRKRIAVKIFVEALHSCFKDGLNGSRDYRTLAGLTVSAPLLYAAVAFSVIYLAPGNSGIVMGGLLLILSFFIFHVRPCKSQIMNSSLCFHWLVFGILSIVIELWFEDFFFSTETLALTLAVLPALPHILILFWVAYKAASSVRSHLKTGLTLFRKAFLQLWKRRNYEELHDY